jgi:hypothetical protein
MAVSGFGSGCRKISLHESGDHFHGLLGQMLPLALGFILHTVSSTATEGVVVRWQGPYCLLRT